MRRKRNTSLLPPHGVRALVPVFGVQGGGGRSTLVGLLARVLAPSVRTLVLDTAPRSASPWADWLGVGTRIGEQGGLPGLASSGLATDRAALSEAAARLPVPLRRGEQVTATEPGEEAGFDVLADTRPWTRPPVAAPEQPDWYARILESGNWSTGVIDLFGPAVVAHLEARNASRPSTFDLWFARQDAVPVLVGTSSAAGPARLERLLGMLDTDGVPAERAVVAIVDVTGGDRPKWLPSELEKLARRVGLLVQVPFDKTIHNDELTRLERLSDSTLNAVHRIAEHVSSSVRHQPQVASEDRVETYAPPPAPTAGPPSVRPRPVAPQPPAATPRPGPPTPTPRPGQPAQTTPGWVPPGRR
ncbi:MAG TPA: hypothetical protein VI076_02315 [Actinopolymorphaceae bacterium]